jgi:peptidoglycan/LPS O-acetylase OafA/YrhL
MKRFTLGDALRGIAAIGVIVGHTKLPVPWPHVNALWPDFFFVLSGFVLSKYYRADQTQGNFGKYAAKRAVRFYPLVIVVVASSYVITWLSGLVLHISGWESRFAPLKVIGAVALLQLVYLPSISVITPLWSLSAEIFVNLGTYWAVRKYGTRMLVALSALGTALVIWQCSLQNEVLNPHALFSGWGSLGRALSGFCLGLLAQKFPTKKLSAAALTLCAALLIGLTWFSNVSAFVFVVAAPVFAYTLRYVYLLEPRFAKTRFTGLAEFLGTSSFGIYVWHRALQPITHQIAVKVSSNSVVISVIDFVLLVTVSVIATRITYRWLEKPTMNWINARTRIQPAVAKA